MNNYDDSKVVKSITINGSTKVPVAGDVNLDDIAGNVEVVNNLTSDSTGDALSAAQGKELKRLIDEIPTDGTGGSVIIDTTMPETPSDTKAPSTKLFKQEVDRLGQNMVKYEQIKSITQSNNTTTITTVKKVVSAGAYVKYDANILHDLIISQDGGLLNNLKAVNGENNIDITETINVIPGDKFKITGCVYHTTPICILFKSNPTRIAGNAGQFADNYPLIPYKLSSIGLYKDLDIVIPDGYNYMIIQGRNSLHASFSSGYELYIQKYIISDDSTSILDKETDYVIDCTNTAKNYEYGVLPSGADYSLLRKDTASIYALFDTLLGIYSGDAPDDANPNNSAYYNVTKRVLGKDQSNTFDINAYIFEPRGYEKTVLFTCGMHGTEKTPPYAMFECLKGMVNKTLTNPVITYMRENVRIIVVPVLNPYGFTNNTYGNVNSVNPSRNFPYYWESYVSGLNSGITWDKKGVAKYSENETKILMNIAIELRGELDYYIDYHTGEDWRNEPFYYFDSKGNESLVKALNDAGNSIKEKYKEVFGSYPSGGAETKESARIMNIYWFNRCLQVPSCTIEYSPLLYSANQCDAIQIKYLMYNYIRYWSHIIAIPKQIKNSQIGIKSITTEEYNSMPYRSYNTIYKLEDGAKKIGDVDF